MAGADTIFIACDVQDADFVRSDIAPLFEERPVEIFFFGDTQEHLPPDQSLVVTYLGDRNVAKFIQRAIIHRFIIGVLPHPDMKRSGDNFGVAGTLADAVEDILSGGDCKKMDVLFCNEHVVQSLVVAGEVFSVRLGARETSDLSRNILVLWQLLQTRKRLRLKPISVATEEDKSLDTAALGIVVVEQGRNSLLSRRVLKDPPCNDGMVNILLFAPRSVLEIFWFILSSFVVFGKNGGRLPPFAGHIKSRTLRISGSTSFDYSLDGAPMSAPEILLSVSPKALRFLPGRNMEDYADECEQKEKLRVGALPVGQARLDLSTKPLPWVRHASADEFRELFLLLKSNATASRSFLALMVLSTLLAIVGLFANSASVIIGAMILAPLMGPIISLAMGAARQDETLLANSAKTLLVGLMICVGVATLATLLIPLRSLNGEISARLSPTLLDLGVALISGTAGAYAHAREDIAKSLAGVAIAVALVPPLAVAGIGIGWGERAVFQGASLLFMTNLVGILFAASITFLCLGFAPFQRARRGVLLSLALGLAVSVPLFWSFEGMVEEQRIVRQLEGVTIDQVVIQGVAIRRETPLVISLRMLSPENPTAHQVDSIKRRIEDIIGLPTKLECAIVLTR
ncbi:MAG: TIGR00341 family protein [Pseudodesulfovibrio sp.]|uniref:TIGR00341 family protein n=1 Tax=Pseudodesulfovibrio aespoeensis (strain ATCC 700646 / DSM 10631 / Aspo-2) TaxID=643562 RepID=E6VW64_PSEA9|nr:MULTISPECIES: TIGR00341 family protein [Pseudodesulfovibrio]MBU4475510.1 TIGR00341 family protein [Pseudomonadota bacterium]ADU63624.1 protein of unknown function DUF389 [Pseudodesulfovibrio aespoeensis Aspo-2]MBU4514716.1 TIGR00341 family protein [Pseudomonadota bacterium]MBU4522260.1 TIGR00341 family protein [Pseudomonadota bacterium]MBU4559488.1 TIGR00341 family protein [Pseudomonadota bacterium]